MQHSLKLMRHPPPTQLPQHGRLAACWHLARPLSVHPQPEGASPGKGQINQLDLQLLLGNEVTNGQAVVRFDSLALSFPLRASRLCRGLIRLFPESLTLAGLPIYVARFPAAPLPVHSIGTWHAPSYRANAFSTSQKPKTIVHDEMYVRVYKISYT